MERPEKLAALRKLMAVQAIDAYIIPASDPHQDEYIPECWQFRSWLSGFTGSAGTVVVTKDTAGLWTDSRYFLQAEKQLKGSGIDLVKLKIPHTPEFVPWLAENLPEASKIGVDDRFFSLGMITYMQDILGNAGHQLLTGLDLLSPVWTLKPKIPSNPVFAHVMAHAGVSRMEKIAKVIETMNELSVDFQLITTLDDIAWLFNLRGSDIKFCPFFISYCVISKEQTHLFINPDKIPENISKGFQPDPIIIHPYEAINRFLEDLPAGSTIYYAPEKVNHSLIQSIPVNVHHKQGMTITTGLKAIKNPVEIEGLKRVMVKDGIAWVRTLHWIEKQMQAGLTESEWSVAKKIAEFRSEQPDYQGESFHAISSFGWHGAVVHYSVTPEESLDLQPDGIFLLDSGGHYSDGTTDTTRTIALSPPDERQKSDFTRALKGTIGVSMLRFPKGTKGFQMDILARKALWDIGLNYGHGTGHGVGFFLSVHEGPQTIGTSASGNLNTGLEPGMVTTVEPAIYREGSYGMRTENMTLVVEDQVNEYGVFYRFETLTLAPVDRNLIDKSLLSAAELIWINSYHSRVYQELSGYLNADENSWLKVATKPL
ncbi:MAG: aminopeptidase P family protein [Bacteroidales bacterium]|jgi:Xaa-Pro aminopeptidase